MKHIYILGTAGSGKSYLANKLSNILKIRSYDLDDIFWEKKYYIKRDEKKREQLLKTLAKKDKWIMEGVFSSWVEPAIKRSDLVIWLDPPFHIIVYRIFIRFFKRKLKRYRETWRDMFILLKYVKNYHAKHQEAGYYKHKRLIEKNNLKYVYLRNKKEINKFLKEIK